MHSVERYIVSVQTCTDGSCHNCTSQFASYPALLSCPVPLLLSVAALPFFAQPSASKGFRQIRTSNLSKFVAAQSRAKSQDLTRTKCLSG